MELGGVETCHSEALKDVVYLLSQRGALDIRDLSRLTCVATFFRDFFKMFLSAADVYRYRMELLRDVGKGLIERLRKLELPAEFRVVRNILIPCIEEVVAQHIRVFKRTDGFERKIAEPPVEAPEQSFSTAELERQYRREIEEVRENLLSIFREYPAATEKNVRKMELL
jgi:hypothetical protein